MTAPTVMAVQENHRVSDKYQPKEKGKSWVSLEGCLGQAWSMNVPEKFRAETV